MARATWFAAYVALALALAFLAWGRPLFGWDLLGYVGAVAAIDTHDPQRVQATAYADVRAATPPRIYAQLTGMAGDDAIAYRRDVARNPDHFAQQLPFYRVRPLYVGLLYVLHKAGLGTPHAVYLVSALSFVVIGILTLIWTSRYLAPAYAAGGSLLLLLTPPVMAVARTPSPDALSAAMVLGALFALVELRQRATFALLMVLAIFVRNDNAIFAVVLFLYFGFAATETRRSASLAIGLALLSAVCYFAINRWAGAYGWSVLFHHTFLGFLPAPAEFEQIVTPAQYAAALKHGARSVVDTALPVFGMLWVLAFGLRRRASLLQDLLGLIAVTVALRYLLFPILWDRLLVPYYILIVVLLIAKGACVTGDRATAVAPVLARRT